MAATARDQSVVERPPRVLLLFSNDRLLPANQRIDEGLRRELDPRGNQSAVEFYGEFLDAIRLDGAAQQEAMERYLRARYLDLPPDVFVALGPQALRFVLARRMSLFPATPLIFAGVTVSEAKEVEGLPGVAGLPMELTVAPVVEALLQMRPQTRELVLVYGSSAFDRNWRDMALLQCAPFAGRVKITALPELALQELKDRLKELPRDAAVLYLTYFKSPTGESYVPARVAGEIADASPVPVVGPYDTYMGSGLLGVGLSPFEEQGASLGVLIRRVLSGEKPEDIGIQPANRNRLILDSRQLKRWRIKSIPAGAERRFADPSLWEQHRGVAIAAISALLVQAFLIAGLVIARSRQRQTEKALRHSEARFVGVFRSSPVAIAMIRKSDGRIVDVNPAWEATTGTSRTAALGRTPLETGMVIGKDAEERMRLFLDSGKLLHDYEQVIRTPAGQTRVLSLSSELLMHNEEAFYILVARDVTERREAEQARRHLSQKSKLSMLGEMTASIAHEINQPLGAILSNADAAEMLLEREELSVGELRQILADIRRDDLRASTVIQRVRTLVTHRDVSRRRVDINELLSGTVRLATPEALHRGVTLDQDLAPGLPEVSADPVQIEQVVLNLLFNAFDAMQDTPLAVRRAVVRSERRGRDSVLITVEDNGHAIPPDSLPRLFEAFFTTKEDGMGLGLSLAHSIIEAHGGRLYAENNPSQGASFHFILPVGLGPADPAS